MLIHKAYVQGRKTKFMFPKVWVLNFLTFIRFFSHDIWAGQSLGLPQITPEKRIPSGSCILVHAWLTKVGTLTCTSWRAGMCLHSSPVAIQTPLQIFSARRELVTIRTFKIHPGLWREEVTRERGFPSPFPQVHLYLQSGSGLSWLLRQASFSSCSWV